MTRWSCRIPTPSSFDNQDDTVSGEKRKVCHHDDKVSRSVSGVPWGVDAKLTRITCRRDSKNSESESRPTSYTCSRTKLRVCVCSTAEPLLETFIMPVVRVTLQRPKDTETHTHTQAHTPTHAQQGSRERERASTAASCCSSHRSPADQ